MKRILLPLLFLCAGAVTLHAQDFQVFKSTDLLVRAFYIPLTTTSFP